MGTVAVIIERISTVRNGVDPVNVVDITVSVIIDSITSNLVWIPPHIRREIGMPVIEAGINDQNNHIGGSRCNIPSRFQRQPLTCIELRITRIVRRQARKVGPVWFAANAKSDLFATKRPPELRTLTPITFAAKRLQVQD